MAHSKFARTNDAWKPHWDFRQLVKADELDEPKWGRKAQSWIGRRWKNPLRSATAEAKALGREADDIVH